MRSRLLCVAGCLLAIACSGGDSGNTGSTGTGGSGGSSGSSGGGTVEQGAACIVTDECKPVDGKEVICECTPDSSETVCTTRLEAGEPCPGGFDAPQCRSGTLCVHPISQPAVCQVLAKLGEDCTSNPCAPTTTCKDGVCAAGSALGEPCNADEPQPCAAGSVCESSEQLCVPLLAEGEECGPPGDARCVGTCVSTAGSPQVCVIPKGEGGPCENAFGCLNEFKCVEQVCVARSKPASC